MPIYEFQCPVHGRFPRWENFSTRPATHRCEVCGADSPYTISAPRVFSDFEPYESPASGKWISGRRERAEDFARTGTRAFEAGEVQDAERARLADDAALRSNVNEAVEQAIGELKNG